MCASRYYSISGRTSIVRRPSCLTEALGELVSSHRWQRYRAVDTEIDAPKPIEAPARAGGRDGPC